MEEINVIEKCYLVAYGQAKYLMKWGEGIRGEGINRSNINEIISPHIFLDDNDYNKKGSFRFLATEKLSSSSYCQVIRDATYEETIWLEECIKLDLFISMESANILKEPPTLDEILKKLEL